MEMNVVGEDSGDFGNKYILESDIDLASQEELQAARELINMELQSGRTKPSKSPGSVNDAGNKEYEEGFEDDGESEEKKSGDSLGSLGALRAKKLDKIKEVGVGIQYNYLTRVNLELLREFGDQAWENQKRNLLNIKAKLQERQRTLRKEIKQISLERKNRQLQLKKSQLDPLLNDLWRVRRENDRLGKIVINKVLENTRE
ncbi:Pre-mRNA-splicing factor SPF27 [Cryptosporidium felis]|nr:Pre-mRNA-splicing factor SPF27 [Cryptosporidium felis]